MIYKELTVLTNTYGSDLVSEILIDCGSEGVSIYDSNDVKELLKSDIYWDYVEESLLIENKVVQVKGYFNDRDFGNIYIEVLSKIIELNLSEDDCGSLEMTVKDIDDSDWAEVWKKYYKPINIKNISIVPNWLSYQALKENEKIVRLDPGMAFGTGEHESTKLCLTLFSEIDYQDKTVLDIGCGSGILGISAGVCGCKSVKMFDIDDIAVKSARENLALNKFDCPISAENSNLLNDRREKGDIVFANITADILILLADQLNDVMESGGILIVSGIIHKRAVEVMEKFLSVGFTCNKEMVMGEWVGIRFIKN